MGNATMDRFRAGCRPAWRGALLLFALLLVMWLPRLAVAGPLQFDVALSYHEDPQGQLDVRQVRALGEQGWTAARSHSVSLGYTASAVWFRLRVDARGTDAVIPVDAIVEIAYPLLKDLQVHGAEAYVLQLGAGLPFAQRPIAHRNFLIPVVVQPGRTLELLVRARTDTAMQFPVQVRERVEREHAEQGVLLMHGAYLGVVLAMLAYNLFMWVALRDQLYGWYLGWMLFIAGFVWGMSGQAYQWWWPDSPQWNQTSLSLMLSLSLVFATEFFARFLQVKRWSLPVWWTNRFILLINGLASVAALTLPYSEAVRLAIACAIFTVPVSIVQAIVIARHGEPAGKLFLLNFSILLAGGIVMALSKIGLLPHAPLTELAPQVGSAIELLLFSFALALRVQTERRLREQAQREVIAQQARLTGELEQRVAERTAELERLNGELASLSRTDALTGLFNRRHLDERLDEEAARCRRLRTPMAVMMIDIDHYKRLNDSHGHAAGDRCLQEVATRLRAGIRLGQDLLARYGGEEFCLLVPATNDEGVETVAERLRRAVADEAVTWGDQRLQLTVSIGVARGQPVDRAGVERLRQQADQALYAAKAGGRNRWALAGSATTGTHDTAPPAAAFSAPVPAPAG
jgi:diguanylate cyclase